MKIIGLLHPGDETAGDGTAIGPEHGDREGPGIVIDGESEQRELDDRFHSSHDLKTLYSYLRSIQRARIKKATCDREWSGAVPARESAWTPSPPSRGWRADRVPGHVGQDTLIALVMRALRRPAPKMSDGPLYLGLTDPPAGGGGSNSSPGRGVMAIIPPPQPAGGLRRPSGPPGDRDAPARVRMPGSPRSSDRHRPASPRGCRAG